MTLVELLVVIVLVGVVAGIALPIVSNLLAGAQTKADQVSAETKNRFINDWTAAGADLVTSNGKIYAVVNGNTVAEISESTGGGNNNDGGNVTLATFNALLNGSETDFVAGSSYSFPQSPLVCRVDYGPGNWCGYQYALEAWRGLWKILPYRILGGTKFCWLLLSMS